MISDLPLAWRKRFDLSEIGFVFLFLPLVVSTMDRPPHLGGLLLLWSGTILLVRGVPDLSRTLSTEWTAFRWVGAPLWVSAVAAVGAVVGPRHALSGMVFLTLHAVLFSLPLCLLAFRYGPRRFPSSGWLPSWAPGLLPAFLFAGLHIGAASWKATVLAFVLGLGGAKVPLKVSTLLHAAVWAVGSRWGFW